MVGFTGSNDIGVYIPTGGKLVSQPRSLRIYRGVPAGVSQLSAQVLYAHIEVVTGALPTVGYVQVGQLGSGHDP